MSDKPLYNRNFLLHLQKRDNYNQPVLIKENAKNNPKPSVIDQLHNEFTITRILAECGGVRTVYAKEGTESRPILLLEFIPGQSLAELIRSTSLDLTEKLRLAVNVAQILSRVHDHQVMHKDISCGNIMISSGEALDSKAGVYLIDFGLASLARQEYPSRMASDDTMAGTLAYISPEQTGRMNRQVDYRTDLYSLGIVLYELFTGQLPFTGTDPLQMIHAHIARQPNPASQVSDEVPTPVSDIILKLIAKNAEDRYQTAQGLQTDLENCLALWQKKGQIKPFKLGSDDLTGRLQIPQKLYGRQAEIEQLQTVLEKAVTERPQLLFVAGYSGVGKTSLVNELEKDIIIKQGNFITGKFDQTQRIQPYSAWSQAFTQLVDVWLTENEKNLANWREIILDAVGESGQILIDIIPILEGIIGPQPKVPKLGGRESQNRFNYIFNRFISNLATPEHPLVIFLDDLQWIDSASLSLIETLLIEQASSGLLIIGAYRDNEVTPDHPLAISQERLQENNEQVSLVKLADLTSDDIDQLLADTLLLKVQDCHSLSHILLEKTSGNPFYFRQLLFTLESDGILSLDRKNRRWKWDEDGLHGLRVYESVVDLMIEKLQVLPDQTQSLLSTAACLGNRFASITLATVLQQSQSDIATSLNPALQEGLIVRTKGEYAFAHDRIQEAGYSMIPKNDLAKTHLEIGQLLMAESSLEGIQEKLFEIVGHLNAGRKLITTDSEIINLAELNLKAGKKAKVASAFSDGKKYIEIGLGLLGPDSWQNLYELTLSLYNENGELAALTGQYDQISTTADLIQANAIRNVDRMRIYMAQIEAETMQYKFAKALEIGLEALKYLGFDIPAQPDAEDYQRLKDRLVTALASKPKENLVELPEMTDEIALAVSSLLAAETTTAYMSNPLLYPIIVYQGAILTLEFGLNAWSPMLFGDVAFLNLSLIDLETPTNVALDHIFFAKQLQQIAQEMMKKTVTAKSQTKTLVRLAATSAWTEPNEKGIELAKATYLSGYENGDMLNSSFGAIQFAKQAFAAGMNLVTYQNQLSNFIDSLSRMGQKLGPQYLAIQLQLAQNFRETLPDPDKLCGIYFDEDKWLPRALALKDLAGRHNHSICKLLLAYYFDVGDRLDKYASEAEDLISGGRSNITMAQFYFYFALSKIRLAWENSTKDDPGTINLVNSYLQLMAIWSKATPSTFQHKYDLIAAEKARVLGDLDSALTHYEQAIDGARENGFTHEEALANELYARFWAERGNDRFAGLFMREAHSLYLKWGALAKAEHLENRYPDWLITKNLNIGIAEPSSSIKTGMEDIDLHTVLKVSRQITSEIGLASLLTRLMEVTIENAGAQKGFLLMEKDGKWVVEAVCDSDAKEVKVLQSLDIEETNLLSLSIINYVLNKLETVVIDDAGNDKRFSNDPYILTQQPHSILCLPLIHQGEIRSILYLENNLSKGAFTSDRVELLRLLSSQIVTTLINARLYSELGISEEKFRGVFESMIDVFIRADLDGKCVLVSPSIYSIIGYTQNELLGRNLEDFYVDPGERKKMVKELLKSKAPGNYVFDAIRKDGEHITVSINAKVVFDENSKPIAVDANIRDITKAKRAEADLVSSEKRFRATFEQAAVGMAHVSLDGKFLRINHKFCDILGYSHHEMLSRTFQDITHPDDLEKDVGHISHLLRGESDTYSLEKRYFTKEGSIVWVNLTVKLINKESGHADYFVSVVEDITDRKNAEQKIIEYQDRLKDLAKELTITEEKVRKGIAVDLHDDVGQILASTRMQISFLHKIEDENEFAEKIVSISETLAIAIQATREAIFNLSPPLLNEIGLYAAVHDWMKEQIEAKYNIRTNMSGQDSPDELDENTRLLLFRSIRELMMNVVKHSRARKMDVDITGQNGTLEITVRDDGKGFIYNPDLIRLKSNSYGLFSIQERIADLGGSMEVDSEINVGTSIKLSIPLN